MSKDTITEVKIMNHFKKMFPQSFFYSRQERIFYLYINNKWVQESNSKVNVDLLIKKAIDDLYGTVSGINNHIANVKKMLTYADPHYIKLMKELDNHVTLLNCENSLVDLKTGEYHPHNKELYITASTGINIVEPTIDENGYPVIPAVFDEFINNLVYRDNDEKTKDRKYMLLKLLGEYLNGTSGKRSFLHIWGKPGTGKSKLANILLYILGDYATPISFSTLASNKSVNGSSPSPEIIESMGKRYAITDEPSTVNKMSASFFKAATGGTTMTARYLYCNYLYKLVSTFTPIICSNSPLLFDEVDPSVIERLTMIETRHPVSIRDRDDYLGEKLKSIAGEILGVLVVLGCKAEERSERLKLNPHLDKLSVDLFDDDKQSFIRDNSDPLDLFFSEKIHLDVQSSVKNDLLWSAYLSFCEKKNLPHVYLHNSFISTLKKKYGLRDRRIDNKRYISGIELIKNETTEDSL